MAWAATERFDSNMICSNLLSGFPALSGSLAQAGPQAKSERRLIVHDKPPRIYP